MNPIEQLLRREIGLDAASVGSSLIERTIRLRMKALGLKEQNQYRDLLTSSRPEWEELIEAVVVTETWFFRDPEAFSALVQLVQAEMKNEEGRMKNEETEAGGGQPSGPSSFFIPHSSLRLLPSPPVRILSVPCATGEEPYSVAMALLDAGVPPARFVIEAVDLSPRALERAQRAVYGRNSFRGQTLEFRDRHFASTLRIAATADGPAGEGFQLHDRVRERVTFQRGNLLAPLGSGVPGASGTGPAYPTGRAENFLARRAPYDFIFCRNLLIYFDRATQAQALRKLHHLLARRGVLFVGPAEMPLVSDHGFAPAGFPMAFACRKAAYSGVAATRLYAAEETTSRTPRRPHEFRVPSSPVPSHSELGTWNSEPTPPPASPRGAAASRAEPGLSSITPRGERRAAEVILDLNTARALADAGKLAEATAICEAHVKAEGPSAQAYYLIGLVRDADGDPAALHYYRKALYLEPDHYETLLQISLLLEKNGDATGARAYKRRAGRLSQRKNAE